MRARKRTQRFQLAATAATAAAAAAALRRSRTASKATLPLREAGLRAAAFDAPARLGFGLLLPPRRYPARVCSGRPRRRRRRRRRRHGRSIAGRRRLAARGGARNRPLHPERPPLPGGVVVRRNRPDALVPARIALRGPGRFPALTSHEAPQPHGARRHRSPALDCWAALPLPFAAAAASVCLFSSSICLFSSSVWLRDTRTPMHSPRVWVRPALRRNTASRRGCGAERMTSPRSGCRRPTWRPSLKETSYQSTGMPNPM